MVAKTEVEVSNKMDTVKLGLSVLILIVGVAGFYYFEAESLLYRVLGLLVLVAFAVSIIYTTNMGRSVVGFARESRIEVRKVVWPTRQETVQTTLMVIVSVIIVGIMLYFIDMILLEAVQYLTGRGE